MRLLKPSKERWVDCFDGFYQVSSLGRVRRNKPGGNSKIGKLLKLQFDKDGYQYCTPSVAGKLYKCRIHQLVAEVFIGPCPNGKEVNHKDTNRSNNVYTNLEYLTSAENTKYSYKLGRHGSLHQFGEDNPYAVLTRGQVESMREDRRRGLTYRELNIKYQTTGSYYAVNYGWKEQTL